MPEEVLKYRVEIDDASLMSEMARARGNISGMLQSALSTGAYSLNSVHADLALTRSMLGGPPQPEIARPTAELGFYRSSLGLIGAPPPPNMLSFEFQRMAQMEMEGRMMQATSLVGREAVPMGLGIGAALLGAGPIGAGAVYGLSRLASPALFNDLEARSTSDIMLNAIRAPHPMLQFNAGQRDQLAGGLMEDVARDVRFGVQEMNQLIAGGQAAGMFSGATNVEEFRGRFRSMMEQVRSITRVFQETTGEALQTMGQFTSMGVGGPAEMQGRVADVLGVSRMSGMGPRQALAIGEAGAQMAAAAGMPSGVGFDSMMRNAMMASAAEATQLIDPNMMRRMGGVQGVAGTMGQMGFQMAQAPGIQQLLAGLANDSMDDLDQSKVRQLMSGNLTVDQLRDQAWSRLGDPAQRMRFSANQDLLMNQLALSGQAPGVLFQFAQYQGQMMGTSGADVFGQLTRGMGMNPDQQRLALAMGRDAGGIEMLTSRSRQLASQELEMERRIEESRFTTRFGAMVEEGRVSFTNAVGAPIRALGRGVEGMVGNLATLPSRLLTAADMWLGEKVFGTRGGGAPGNPEEMRRRIGATSQEAMNRLQNSIHDVAIRTDFSGLQTFQDLSEDDKDAFEQQAIGTFAPALHSLYEETDPKKRGEQKEKLRQDMKSWIRTNFNLSHEDRGEADHFADTLLGIEAKADHNEHIRKGLDGIVRNSAAVQMQEYVGQEIPSLLAWNAGEQRNQERLTSIGLDVASSYTASKSPMAAYQAMKMLGERAVPLLSQGSELRGRLEVGQMAINQGFLRPGDMELDTGELATIKKQALSAGQQRFVEELEKAANAAEGHKLSADQLFRGMGMGLGGQYPSSTPSPMSGLDPMKGDMTIMTLDRLTGAVNNLHNASEELLRSTRADKNRNAGKS